MNTSLEVVVTFSILVSGTSSSTDTLVVVNGLSGAVSVLASMKVSSVLSRTGP